MKQTLKTSLAALAVIVSFAALVQDTLASLPASHAPATASTTTAHPAH